jgi:hypothetical protein
VPLAVCGARASGDQIDEPLDAKRFSREKQLRLSELELHEQWCAIIARHEIDSCVQQLLATDRRRREDMLGDVDLRGCRLTLSSALTSIVIESPIASHVWSIEYGGFAHCVTEVSSQVHERRFALRIDPMEVWLNHHRSSRTLQSLHVL